MTGNGKLLIQFLKNVETIVIPVYQRNYDWKIEHCRKLFQDLCSTIQKRRMHFFGGIVSVSDPMGGTFDFLIIDGQQRLTTISLLVLAMANLIRDGKVKPNDPYLYDTLTKKFLVDDVNPNHHKLKLKPIKGDRSAYEIQILHRIICTSTTKSPNRVFLSTSSIMQSSGYKSSTSH